MRPTCAPKWTSLVCAFALWAGIGAWPVAAFAQDEPPDSDAAEETDPPDAEGDLPDAPPPDRELPDRPLDPGLPEQEFPDQDLPGDDDL